MRVRGSFALALTMLTLPLAASLSQGATVASASVSSAPIVAFRRGLEVSVDGSAWGRVRSVTLPPNRCAPGSVSPCSPGTPPLVLSVRFPALPQVVDGSKVLSQLGESGGPAVHYFVRPVPANAKSSVCGPGFAVSAPMNAMRVTINLGESGTPLPVTCRWTAVAGVPDASSPVGFYMVWSDTVVVQVSAK